MRISCVNMDGGWALKVCVSSFCVRGIRKLDGIYCALLLALQQSFR